MKLFCTCIFLCIMVFDVLTSDLDQPRTKRQMDISNNGPNLFPTTKVGNTLRLKYFFDSDVIGTKIPIGWERLTKLFEEHTCLRFFEVKQEAKDVAKITRTVPEAWSDTPGLACFQTGNVIKLEERCGNNKQIGVMLHEFMHLLGFKHVIQRADRDKYVTYDVTKGEAGRGSVISENTATEFPFDYGSILSEYEGYSCINGRCSNLTVKDPKYRGSLIGQYNMQYYDYYMVNHYYKCLENCDQKNHKCQYYGYPNPTDCSKCVCPPGYGGQYCTERANACGETYSADSEWNMIERLERPGRTPERTDERCYHLITAPPGKWIEYNLTQVNRAYYDSLFIYGNEDTRMSPYNFNLGLWNEQANRLMQGVYRGNALRFETDAIFGMEHFFTRVKYRYVYPNGTIKTTASTMKPTTTSKPITTVRTTTTAPPPTTTREPTTATRVTTTTKLATRTPDAYGNFNSMIGQLLCAPAGSNKPPVTAFERNNVRALLQILTNTTNPRFIIVVLPATPHISCPGGGLLYKYQLVIDYASKSMKSILVSLYKFGDLYWPQEREVSNVWHEYPDKQKQQMRELMLDRYNYSANLYTADREDFSEIRESAQFGQCTILADEAK